MKVAFLVQLPRSVSPGQRFRIENFEPIMKQNGIQPELFPFIDTETHRILYKKGHIVQKIFGVLRGFAKRIFFLFKAGKYDYIFLQREEAPIGPPVFEWILTKLMRKKMILDFDDAIWISDSKNKLLNWIKAYWKIKWLCKWAYKVSVGNEYLYSFASKYNNNVVLIPTCVDVVNQHNKLKDQKTNPVVVGWTGSHSTLRYLDPFVPLFREIASGGLAEILIISNKAPDFSFPGMRFISWQEKTEAEDILNMNIGIMPLKDDAWSEGKCGLKLIQYLSLGIPALASPVGVNSKIIEPGINGYLCTTEAEWKANITDLISNEQKRVEMGYNGRKKMVEQFSIQANTGVFLGLFS